LEIALTECYERLEAIGASTAEARARKILGGLGFTLSSMDRPTGLLSGGWAMRAALGAALFVNPNLLLLDEVSVGCMYVLESTYNISYAYERSFELERWFQLLNAIASCVFCDVLV